MGAFFLKRLDERMERSGLFYVRFMDDIRVLSPTRRKIRKVVEVVNGMPGSLGLEKHPDKTFIGRVERGFDFLGYHFGPDGITVAEKDYGRREDDGTVRSACGPALPARAGGGCGLLPVWAVHATVGQVGSGPGFGP